MLEYSSQRLQVRYDDATMTLENREKSETLTIAKVISK